jgi:transposase
VAKEFKVSPYTVQRFLNQYRLTRNVTPQKLGSKRKSVLSEYKEVALKVVEEHPDWTLWQYCEYLTEHLGINISTSMMDRFCHEHRLTLKKEAIGTRRSKPKQYRESGLTTGKGYEK